MRVGVVSGVASSLSPPLGDRLQERGASDRADPRLDRRRTLGRCLFRAGTLRRPDAGPHRPAAGHRACPADAGLDSPCSHSGSWLAPAASLPRRPPTISIARRCTRSSRSICRLPRSSSPHSSARSPATHARLMMNAYLAAGVIASIAATIGYFDLVPSLTDLLTLFGRARGPFKDPNVLGAFLAPAIVFAMLIWLERPGLRVPRAARRRRPYDTCGPALFLARRLVQRRREPRSSSAILSLVTARTTRRQLRLLLLVSLGVIGMAGIVIAAMQLEVVQDLMEQRASLSQDYDVGPEGRFAGQEKAKDLRAPHPLGIGALRVQRPLPPRGRAQRLSQHVPQCRLARRRRLRSCPSLSRWRSAYPRSSFACPTRA